MNSLPQVFAGQGSNISNGASGTATLNLRGLGSERTLVLVNGRRVTGPGRLLDRFAVSGELRRSKDMDGITRIVTSAAGDELVALAEREPAVRIEPLLLEELFAEVAQ